MEIPEEENMLQKKCNGYMALLIAELLLIILLLPGSFSEEKRMMLLDRESIVAQMTVGEDSSQFQSERMKLAPGVYRIEIKSQLAKGQQMLVEMKCDSSSFKALHGNSVTIFSGDNYEDFNIYVADKIPTAYVQCLFMGTDGNAVEQLSVYKTNLGNKMLLFIAVLGCVILDFFVVFRKRILEGKVTGKQQIVFWTLAIGVLLAYFPYLTDYFFFGYDTTFHLSRIAHLSDSLQQGALFPVRMQGAWLCEHGYPVSMFYGDLFLYFPAVLMLIGFSIMTSYKAFVFVALVATALVAYYSFKKCVKDEYAALFGSMVYLLVPYRLFNVYGRGALGEFLAMIFLPLICCGMYLLYTDDTKSKNYKTHKWYLILGISGVLQCHLLSAEMVVIFMALVCVIFWKKTFQRKTVLQFLEATGITLLINAWFLVPLLYMMSADSYNLQKITQEDVQSRGLLLGNLLQLLPNRESIPTDVWGREPAHPGACAIMLLVIYAVWSYTRWKHDKKSDKICNCLAIFSVVAVVLCTGYLPWNVLREIPGIGFLAASLQFPWRWMSPATVLMSLFSAFFFGKVKKDGGVYVKTAVGIAATVMLFSTVYQVNRYVVEENPIYLYTMENIGTCQVVSAEYLLLGTNTSDIYYHNPVAENGLEWTAYEKKGTNVSLLLNNTTNETKYIEIPLIGYKGYAIEAEGAENVSIAEERGSHGDLRIAVPTGYQGKMRISYEGVVLFHVAEAVSLISIIFFLCMHFVSGFKEEKLRIYYIH